MTRRIHEIDMPPAQRQAYDDLVEKIVSDGVDPFDPGDNGVHLTWLSLYASATGSIDGETGGIVLGVPSSKSAALGDLLDSFDGVPTVVFAVSRQLFELVYESHKVNSRSWARTGARESHDGPHQGSGRKRFADGKKDLLLTTTHRDIGMSYPRARRAVFLQRSWYDSAHLWTLGALPKGCEIVSYVSSGTVECLQHHGLARLAEQARSPEHVRELLYGRWKG